MRKGISQKCACLRHGHILSLLNTSVQEPRNDSDMSSCGVEHGVRTCRKTPSAYNQRTAGYDNPRRINSTVSARSHNAGYSFVFNKCKEVYKMNRDIRHTVALSGGKDSTAMALRLRELNPDINYEYVITPTGDELPEMAEHWENLERILDVNLKVINSMTLEECIEQENMIPNFRARFCTRILKIEPFIDYMESLPADSVMYVGLRADEDGRLGLVQPGAQFAVNLPMQEWGWRLDDVVRYLKFRNVSVPTRTDCGCCFFQRLPEWKTLLEDHPERYAHYESIEIKRGYTFRSPGRDTWPADLKGLRIEIESGRSMRKTSARKKNSSKCRFCSM